MSWFPSGTKRFLFTPAGMNQFKDHFLGNVELDFTRATTCQKCLRTGDIDNVGRTAYHHTFFEMLGNFSFGDYFKREAIQWAWEFLTDRKWLGIDSDRLTVTIYLDDDEAAEIWGNVIGLSNDRITREDEDENFWPAEAPSKGPDGVCGPCSEIYYTGNDGKKVEIWNLVFTQFNRCGDPPDPTWSRYRERTSIPEWVWSAAPPSCRASIRITISTCCDRWSKRPVKSAARNMTPRPMTDESCGGSPTTFALVRFPFTKIRDRDPGAKTVSFERWYVEPFLDGYQMGMRESFLHLLVPKVVELMGSTYPEISETVNRVQDTLKAEEDGFLNTVETGITRVTPLIEKLKSDGVDTVPGEEIFRLRTTFGIPYELVEKLALDNGLKTDQQGFQDWMKKHGTASTTSEVGVMGGGPMDLIKKEIKSTPFLGYDQLESESVIRGIISNGNRVTELSSEQDPGDPDNPTVLVLDRSPFYAESGGQVGDTGTIQSDEFTFEVTNTQKDGDVIKHLGQVKSGTVSEGSKGVAQVDSQRRDGIRRAHSATHIIHYALQKAHQPGCQSARLES